MSKTKILLIQIAGCLALGAVLGVAFWLFDGGRREPDCKFDETGVGTITASFGASKQWIMIPGTCTVFGKCTPMKIYQGKWHKDYSEVMK